MASGKYVTLKQKALKEGDFVSIYFLATYLLQSFHLIQNVTNIWI